MAKTKTVTTLTITKDCKCYKKPSTSAKVYCSLKKGNHKYTNPTKTNNGKWWKIGNGMYVQASNCKITTSKVTVKSSKISEVTLDNKTDYNKLSKQIDKGITTLILTNNQKIIDTGIDGSMKLFGLPHQLTSRTDFRLSKKTKLGVMFTETFVAEAPIVYIKPGGSNFLPGMTKTQKKNMIKAIVESSKNTAGASISAVLDSMDPNNDWRYFDFIGQYADYMQDVNMLCRVGSVFLGLNNTPVPWSKKSNKTFGVYNWKEYNFDTRFSSDVNVKSGKEKQAKKDYASLIKNMLNKIIDDDEWIEFYVNANASFNESASNSTTNSMISDFTEQLSGLGKEVAFVSGLIGTEKLNVDDLLNGGTSTVDSTINSLAKGDGAIKNFLKKLTGVGKQVLKGGNFLTPEIWGSSDYSKSYSFTVTLSTPYGNEKAWYLNVYVPLMHLLALALPKQITANTYMAPRLVRAYSPGWYSCDLGIIDSISIDKGGSGDAWTVGGLPNEVSVTISIKDLYANLALPTDYSPKTFFSNTSLINYLMVNCGVNITKNSMDDKVKIFVVLMQNLFTSTIELTVAEKVESFRDWIRENLNLFS